MAIRQFWTLLLLLDNENVIQNLVLIQIWT